MITKTIDLSREPYFEKYIKANTLYKASRLEIGKLNSELDEAKDYAKKAEERLKITEARNKELEAKLALVQETDREGMLTARKEKEYQILKTTVENQRVKIKEFQAANRELINKNVRLEMKVA